MKKMDRKTTMLQIYLLSRFVIKACKKLDKDKTIRFTILGLIDKRPMTVRKLADLFTVNHSFMSATICEMEHEGLIKKTVSKDQRCRTVSITGKGKKARSVVGKEGNNIAKVLFQNMTKEEIGTLGILISKVNKDYKALTSNRNFDYKSLMK
jgi:DNA-binding MarR family transcriptional regulator